MEATQDLQVIVTSKGTLMDHIMCKKNVEQLKTALTTIIYRAQGMDGRFESLMKYRVDIMDVPKTHQVMDPLNGNWMKDLQIKHLLNAEQPTDID